MSYLDNVARPGLNAFQPLYCTKCGVIVGIRTGGGTFTDDGSDDEIEARFDLHTEFHDRVDRIERMLVDLRDDLNEGVYS